MCASKDLFLWAWYSVKDYCSIFLAVLSTERTVEHQLNILLWKAHTKRVSRQWTDAVQDQWSSWGSLGHSGWQGWKKLMLFPSLLSGHIRISPRLPLQVEVLHKHYTEQLCSLYTFHRRVGKLNIFLHHLWCMSRGGLGYSQDTLLANYIPFSPLINLHLQGRRAPPDAWAEWCILTLKSVHLWNKSVHHSEHFISLYDLPTHPELPNVQTPNQKKMVPHFIP